MSVLTDLRNRGVKDVFFVVCDGLKGLPEVVSNVWPQAIVQTSSINNGWAGMVSAFTCTTTGRTCANASPSRSTRRPVRPWWRATVQTPSIPARRRFWCAAIPRVPPTPSPRCAGPPGWGSPSATPGTPGYATQPKS
jgi:hypothetical protein